jgi:hypothetical protein
MDWFDLGLHVAERIWKLYRRDVARSFQSHEQSVGNRCARDGPHLALSEISKYLQGIVEKGGLSRPPGQRFS